MKMTNYLKELWQRVKHRQKDVFIVLFTSIGTTICFLLLPILIQTLIDNTVLSVIKNPWYVYDETSLEVNTDESIGTNLSSVIAGEYVSHHIVEVDGKNFTQDIKQGENTADEWQVMYDGNQPYFISQITNESIELTTNDMQQLYGVNMKLFTQLILLYLLVVAIHPLFAWVNTTVVKRFARDIIADFRLQGLKKLQKLPIDYFTKRQDGKFISYIISDVSMFYSIATNVGVQLLQAAIMFLGIYVILFFINIKIFFVALASLPFLALWVYAFRKYILVYYEKARHASSTLNALLNEQFKGSSVIHAFNYEAEAAKEFEALNTDVYAFNEKSLKVRSRVTGSLVNVIRRSLWFAILAYAGTVFFQSGTVGLSVGTIYLLVSLVNYYIEPMYQFFSIMTIIEQANVSIQRFFRYLAEEEETERATAITTSVPRFAGAVRFEDMSFGYNPETTVLKNINLDIKANQSVAIVGHTGSGKSSLMNLLLRFYDYSEGKILVDNVEITEMTRDVYREHVGIILQDPVLFKGTLLNTITWGNPKFTAEFVAETLVNIGAGELLQHPDGLQQEVAEMGVNFSLGQRQLIAFARAIIQNPSILVLDEATANIDTETERKIQYALAVASKDRTTFVIAHRLSTIQHSDVIVVLDKGEIIEQGTHTELLEQGGTYFEMYQSQLQNAKQ